MKIAVKEVTKDLVIEETEVKYVTDCVRKYIGKENYPQRVRLYSDTQGDLSLCVDDEGLLKDLPINFLLPMPHTPWPIQKMVGNVVFVRTKPVDPFREIYDFEITDLTAKDILYIKFLLQKEMQDKLHSNFKDYGKGQAIIHVLK